MPVSNYNNLLILQDTTTLTMDFISSLLNMFGFSEQETRRQDPEIDPETMIQEALNTLTRVDEKLNKMQQDGIRRDMEFEQHIPRQDLAGRVQDLLRRLENRPQTQNPLN